MDQLIGDHRQVSTGVGESAKVTVVWNTKTGGVAILIHQSCTSTDYQNLFTLAKTAGGGLSVRVSAVDAWSPSFRSGGKTACEVVVSAVAPDNVPSVPAACDQLVDLGRISDQITVTPSGGTYSVKLVGDKYPSWEFYRYPVDGVMGSLGIEKTIGTRGQTTVFDLKGSPAVSCTSQSGEAAPNGCRPMACS